MYGTYSNLIIIGQPGIGIDFNLSFGRKIYLICHQGITLSLYYVLSVRIAKSQPTLFQVNEEEVWFFNASGVHRLEPKTDWKDVPTLDSSCCALVDANYYVQTPAKVISSHGAPFFILQASSPRERNWHWIKYHGPSVSFYTKPFSWEEILMGTSVTIKLEPANSHHFGKGMSCSPNPSQKTSWLTFLSSTVLLRAIIILRMRRPKP
jgi:hypothetical protein